MAGFMDMLGKKTETESGSSYQKSVIREIARKLAELEEQNDQNALAIEEIRKMQKTVLQKLDSLKEEQKNAGEQASEGPDTEALEDIKRQLRTLTQQVQASVQNLDGRLQAGSDAVGAGLQNLDGKMQEMMEHVSAQKAEDTGILYSEELSDKLDTVRLSLEDTIHKENIKCFRNVQGALEEQGDGKAYDLNALRKYLKVIVWFQLITIVLIVLRILGLL